MTSSSYWTRRDVLSGMAGGTATALIGFVPTRMSALTPHDFVSDGIVRPAGTIDPSIIIDETDVRSLAQLALDAAKGAGASYADVRLIRVLKQSFEGYGVIGESTFSMESEELSVGVRAFVDGGWGFAASPYWDSKEVVELARNAARQAKGNARYAATSMDWAHIPVASGSWKAPIKIDPFVVPVEEKNDLLTAWFSLKARYETVEDRAGLLQPYQADFTREERAVATSDGAFFTQTFYTSGGEFTFRHKEPGNIMVPAASMGWERFTEANLPEQIRALYTEGVVSKGPASKAGEIGRYDVVFDGESMAALLDATVAPATQLDRALGYDANTSGTSFLGPDPLALLGSSQVASPVVTVTANRTMPQGLATVKWDDEGVEPEPFTLIKDGVLIDYQTTRDQAGLLAPYYQKNGIPVRSHGCAASQDATFITMQHTPNLLLEPGKGDGTFDTLVAGTKRGLAVMNARVESDFQARNGMGEGRVQEIIDGRLGPIVNGLLFVFNTQQLWKNVNALGGESSVVRTPGNCMKGQPLQRTQHTVQAVPARILNVDFIDATKKA